MPSASARSTPPSAAITVASAGSAGIGCREGPASGEYDDRSVLHAHTSAGITQIRFCGSVAR